MYTFEELTLLSKIEAYLNSRSSTQYLKGLRGDDMVVVKQENLPSSSMALSPLEPMTTFGAQTSPRYSILPAAESARESILFGNTSSSAN